MKLLIIRHGETECNAKQISQSPTEPLNDTRISQAKRLAEWLKDKKIDFIYLSPFTRTKMTPKR